MSVTFPIETIMDEELNSHNHSNTPQQETQNTHISSNKGLTIDNTKEDMNSNKDSNNKDSIDSRDIKDIEFCNLMREQGVRIRRTQDVLKNRYKSSLPLLDVESALNYALYTAWLTFNHTSSFNTYYNRVAINELNMEIRSYKRHNGEYTTQRGVTRINLSYDCDDELLSAIEFTPATIDIPRQYDATECLTCISNFIDTTKGRLYDIMSLLLKGYTTGEVCDELGVSTGAVSRAKRKFKARFLKTHPYYSEYISSL
jgi:RNA polymerase sigma factor (sigma-70 family)